MCVSKQMCHIYNHKTDSGSVGHLPVLIPTKQTRAGVLQPARMGWAGLPAALPGKYFHEIRNDSLDVVR